MKLKRLSPSLTELELRDGTRVLVSFEIPVAAFLPRRVGGISGPWVKTDKYVSRTSQEHVRKWIAQDVKAVVVVAHEYLTGLIANL